MAAPSNYEKLTFSVKDIQIEQVKASTNNVYTNL